MSRPRGFAPASSDFCPRGRGTGATAKDRAPTGRHVSSARMGKGAQRCALGQRRALAHPTALSVLRAVDDGNDGQLVEDVVNAVNDNVGQATHDPFVRATRSASVTHVRKKREPFVDALEDGVNDRPGIYCKGLSLAIQSWILCRSTYTSSRIMTFMRQAFLSAHAVHPL